MNCYYDLILNFSEENIPFYEWDENDDLEYIEKIPLYKISEKDMSIILQNNIKIDKDFLDLIEDKTFLKKAGLVNAIEYAVILTDTKSSIALEFDKQGNLLYRSNLMLEDDLNVIEMAFTLNKKNIKYEVINEIKMCDELRVITKMRNTIKDEIVKLYQDKNISKLSFLFLEWFGKNESNLKNMYLKMLKDLEKDYDENHYKIYELIKLSYSKI